MKFFLNKHTLLGILSLVTTIGYSQLVVNSTVLNIPSNISLVTGSLDITGGNENVHVEGDLIIKGNIENHTSNETVFTPTSTGYVQLGGNQEQQITGGIRFQYLELNNPLSVVLQGVSRIEIAHILRFLDGYVKTGTGIVQFLDDANHIGANNSAFVEGTVSKKGDEAFIFPIGKEGIYKPFSQSGQGGLTDEIEVIYNTGLPVLLANSPLNPEVRQVCVDEYWEVNKLSGTSILAGLPTNTALCTFLDPDFITLIVHQGTSWNPLQNNPNIVMGLSFLQSTENKTGNIQYYTYGETAHLVLDVSKVNNVDYQVTGTGLVESNYNTVTNSIIKISPTIPSTGLEDKVKIKIEENGQAGIGTLDLYVYYDDKMEVTKLRADIGEGEQ
jgi:hypothetical protein